MHIDDLLKLLVDQKGSDLHLKAGLPPAIRLRGKLKRLDEIGPLSPDQAREIIYGILTPEQRTRFETDPAYRFELDFAYSVSGVGRFRFNVHKQRGTLGACVRALASTIPSLQSLNLPPAVSRMTEATKGMALVTGPTGSGKSTTLASIIDCINQTRSDHILTIEDPIEYIHNSKRSYVTQREIGETADTLTFKNALKTALRQDPDVILIGEMRDYETIGIAITSAETGHLVFGTLHTNSCAQTIGRIVDVFPTDQHEQIKTQLGGNLFGVLSQILLPTIDGQGRACACEIMFSNSAIRNNIRQNNIEGLYQAIQTGSREGMQTLDQALGVLIQAKKIDYETAKPYIRDAMTHRQYGTAGGDGEGAPAGGNGSNRAVSTPAPAPEAPDPEPDQRRRYGGIVIPPWEKK